MALVRVGPVRIAISALAPFRPPGWGSVGCRTFVELNLSGALDARHHLGDGVSVSGGLCQLNGTERYCYQGVDRVGCFVNVRKDLIAGRPTHQSLHQKRA